MTPLHILAVALAFITAAHDSPAQPPSQPLIDETQTVTLWDNVHPLARPEFDQGPVSPQLAMERMLLLLKPSTAQQTALDALTDAQHDPHSLAFHRWLTPAAYAARFGAGPADLARIHAWLQNHGFTVDEIPAGNRLIVFSGTAGQVAETFHTQIDRYRVAGVDHIANSQPPQIPAALAPLVSGIVSLHDFRRASTIAQRRPLAATPQFNLYGSHYLFPADLAAIYHLTPLYSAGTTGSGVTIAIAGRSNISVSDVEAFRAAASLKPNLPTIILDGNDPGLVAGDQDESTLDVEWAGAVAPEATVKLVAAASTSVTDGVDLSAQYIVNHALAPVVSLSYASCEQQMGAAELAFYNSLWQQAASQGMSVLVASGDAGAAGCNQGSDSTATTPAVNGLCSSPYSTCIGGTEFDDRSDPAQYWAQMNAPNQSSALGYIPEVVWNESGANGGAWLWATGGGISQIYAQPSWQLSVPGTSPANGMRAVPDVALTAAAHDGYIITENGGNWIVSGTSAATPSLAAIMALVVQSIGATGQGNANAVLYSLASTNASPFHPTPSGSNSVPGLTGFSAASQIYNLATGLGSVDADLLVGAWQSAAPPPTLTLAAPAAPSFLLQGQSASIPLTVATSGSFKGNISLNLSGLPAGVSAQWSNNPLAPQATPLNALLTLNASPLVRVGSASLIVQATGDGLTATAEITLCMQPSRFRVSRPPLPILLRKSP